jgi:hypothetical protein
MNDKYAGGTGRLMEIIADASTRKVSDAADRIGLA